MLLFMSTLLVFSLSLTPMKLSFCLTLMSIVVGVSSYSTSSSVLAAAAIIISFSSGMMILFSYCSLMSKHEQTNNKPSTKTLIFVPLVGLLTLITMNQGTSTTIETSLMMSQPTLILLMMVVMSSMVCINKVLFNPNKTMMQNL